MTKFIITRWHVGFNKVQFNHFLQDTFSMGLAEAKSVVDRVMNDEEVELELADHSASILQKLTEFGLKFTIEP